MQKQTVQFSYQVFASLDALSIHDQALFIKAQEALALAHAPYSKFNVGAAAILENGEIIKAAIKKMPVTLLVFAPSVFC